MKQAPVSIVILLALGFWGGWAVAGGHYSERIQVLQARIDSGPVLTTPASMPNINAPSGIAIGGGTVSNPTVNNFGAPPWLLNKSQIDRLVAELRSYAKPGNDKLLMGNMGDPESLRLTEQFVEVFKAAGWEMPISNWRLCKLDQHRGRLTGPFGPC